ncbi:CCA tRNA nucleotidyltransferase [Macrococcoides caseolyticum]|uniref:CCA tRNA nucleotidyltransferase n=1 Tax=Macrococcoides caseolyticum TaxID=69966 RepID=UPI001F3027BD|nr:CCA tRNA nucleotidyltransferase [Macrococcus caseolyticus]MCE4957054.1 CCA tRNA nucleotidyltransferase [Macrococcus caseolyticus]
MKVEFTNLNDETKSLIDAALKIIDIFHQHGYEAYIVGGAVRNILLKKNINDIDITTNCLPETILTLFKRTIPVGLEHGTVVVLWEDYPFEVTTFRIDGEYTDHRRPEQVHFVTDLKSDLERRDFTINALALSESYHVIDYFDGKNDLINKKIRAVGDAKHRFKEDALRMLRALRFQSVLNFDIETSTLQAIHSLSSTIAFVSIERIVVELRKLLLGQGVKNALNIFYQGMHQHVPFFRFIQDRKSKYMIQTPIDLNMYIAYIIFNEMPYQDLYKNVSDLKLSNQDKKNIKSCVEIFNYMNCNTLSLKSFVYRYDVALILNVIHWIKAEGLMFDGLLESEQIIKTSRSLPIQSREEIVINGHDLMYHLNRKAGPWLKEILNEIEIEIIEGRLSNQRESILEWANQYV